MLLEMAMKEFELDCKVRKLSERTIKNYTMILKLFRQFMERERGSSMLEKITSKDEPVVTASVNRFSTLAPRMWG